MSSCLITFAFSVEGAFMVPLEAEVELPGPIPHYHARNIHLACSPHKGNILPDVFVKCIAQDGKHSWVHIDSGLPSDLSTSIGNSLEKVLLHIEMSPPGGPHPEPSRQVN
jgi:hypothetical protein